jgi:iron(III) transport system substrate-binding protein
VNTAKITAEAQSGQVVGDIGVLTDTAFLASANQNKWLVDPTSLNFPAVKNFPQQFVINKTAFTQVVATYDIAYNTNLVKGNDVPTRWTDVLDPKWKGRIIIPDPRGNSSTLTWFYAMWKTYGDSFLTGFRAQNPQVVASSVTGLNSIGSGDAAMLLTNNQFEDVPLVSAGAPIGDVNLDPTTSLEEYMFMVAGGPHPNAAALFLNYSLSDAGQYAQCAGVCSSVLNVPGTVPVSNYQPMGPQIDAATAAQAQVLSLLGLS